MRILLSIWKNPILVAGDQLVGEATWKLLVLLLPKEIVKSKAEVSLGDQRCHCHIKVRVVIPKSPCISPIFWEKNSGLLLTGSCHLTSSSPVTTGVPHDSLLKQVHTSLVRWYVVAFDVKNCTIPIFKGHQNWFLRNLYSPTIGVYC